MKSVSLADLRGMGYVLLIGLVDLVSARFPAKCPISCMGEIGVDDKDCFDDQDWTYGENLND